MNSPLNPIARILIPALLVVSACIALPASASEQIITLSDGSRIRGEIVGMQGGKYSIKTNSLGLVQVDAERVASISAADAVAAQRQPRAATPASSTSDAVQRIESTLATNPTLLGRILSLESDPDMQAALHDPEVMRAVQSFDLDALMKNPKFQALLSNPRIREIQSGVQ